MSELNYTNMFVSRENQKEIDTLVKKGLPVTVIGEQKVLLPGISYYPIEGTVEDGEIVPFAVEVRKSGTFNVDSSDDVIRGIEMGGKNEVLTEQQKE